MRWSAQIHTAFHVCRITQEHPRAALDFGYGDVTLYVGTFQCLLLSIAVPRRGPTTPETSLRFGLFRFRSPLLTESILFLFLRLLRCFTSAGLLHWTEVQRCTDMTRYGFSHSEIVGSTDVCSSPTLIAACHVLPRLWLPRHPPYALSSL